MLFKLIKIYYYLNKICHLNKIKQNMLFKLNYIKQ